MNGEVDALHRALDTDAVVADARVRELLVTARQLVDSLGALAVPPAARRRMRARAYAMARRRRAYRGLRALTAERRATVIGAAGVTVAAAAVGIAVIRLRRGHAPALA